MSNETSPGTIAVAVLGGAVVGAGLALLYAPQSGRKTRQDIKDMSDEATEYAKDMIERAEEAVMAAKKTGGKWLSQGQDLFEEKRQQLAEIASGL